MFFVRPPSRVYGVILFEDHFNDGVIDIAKWDVLGIGDICERSTGDVSVNVSSSVGWKRLVTKEDYWFTNVNKYYELRWNTLELGGEMCGTMLYIFCTVGDTKIVYFQVEHYWQNGRIHVWTLDSKDSYNLRYVSSNIYEFNRWWTLSAYSLGGGYLKIEIYDSLGKSLIENSGWLYVKPVKEIGMNYIGVPGNGDKALFDYFILADWETDEKIG